MPSEQINHLCNIAERLVQQIEADGTVSPTILELLQTLLEVLEIYLDGSPELLALVARIEAVLRVPPSKLAAALAARRNAPR
jgi:hypothetical protein